MCLALYLASDTPLQTSTWSQEKPAPYLGALYGADQATVRQHFSKEFMYAVGSDTNCSCGFDYNSNYPDAEGDDLDAAVSRQWLVETVREALRHQQTVEIFACWSGNESEPIIERKNTHPDALTDRRILDEGHLLVISENPIESVIRDSRAARPP